MLTCGSRVAHFDNNDSDSSIEEDFAQKLNKAEIYYLDKYIVTDRQKKKKQTVSFFVRILKVQRSGIVFFMSHLMIFYNKTKNYAY